jgi:hypothetical protein
MTTSNTQEQTRNTAATSRLSPVPPKKKAPAAKKRSVVASPKARLSQKPTKHAAAVRRGSKTAKILDLLKRSAGASLKEIMKATGWQAHSVRGFLSGTVAKKMGAPVESFKRDDERAYRISS